MKNLSIYDIIELLSKKKRIIILFTLFFSIIAVAYSLLTPKYWISQTTFLPEEDNSSALNFGAGSLLGLGANLMGGVFQGEGVEMLAIMSSREFIEDVINKFDLINYFEINEMDELSNTDIAVNKVTESLVKTSMSDESGILVVKVESRDKQLSMDIANYYIESLNNYYLNVRASKGKRQRIFLEQRVYEVNATIDSLSNELVKFQESTGLLEPTQQIASIIGLFSDLLIKKTENDLQLEIMKASSDNNNPLIKDLEMTDAIISKKISQLEGDEESSYNHFILPLNSISSKSAQYTKILMQIEVQKLVYQFVYPQYEQAKIDEVKDLPTIQIIDTARKAGIRSKPKRAKICVLVFLGAFIFISSLLIFLEHIAIDDRKKLLSAWNNIKKF